LPKSAQRHRGLLLAVLLTAVVVVARHYQERVDYWHAHLPNFDSYVFAAMAENPAYFTVAPWGYRLLHPWIVSTLPARFLVRGFEAVCFGFLAITGGLLFLFLRRLGHSELAALLGVAAFALSPPVAEAVRVPFLGEPVALATQLAFIVALEAGAGVGVLGLLLAVAAFAKPRPPKADPRCAELMDRLTFRPDGGVYEDELRAAGKGERRYRTLDVRTCPGVLRRKIVGHDNCLGAEICP